MSAPFVWFDHRSDDPATTAKFYESLLGWTRATQSPPGIVGMGAGDRPWGGMTEAEGIPGGWLAYVQVDDPESAAEQAQELGGELVRPRSTGPAGDYVVIRDPGGGLVALWTPA